MSLIMGVGHVPKMETAVVSYEYIPQNTPRDAVELRTNLNLVPRFGFHISGIKEVLEVSLPLPDNSLR